MINKKKDKFMILMTLRFLLTSPYQIFGIDIPETLPVTVIIDRDLNVKEVLRGPQTKESIIQRLELIN